MAVPIRTLLAGITDANGNATVQVNAPPTMYGVLTLVATCAGNPSWTVKAGGQLLLVGTGPSVNLGPTLTNPNELLTITVSSGAPNAQVTGTLAGTAHLTAEEAADNYTPIGNPLTVNTATPPIVLGSIKTTGNGIAVVKTFPVPAGVQAVGWSVQFQGFGNPQAISIKGHDTGRTYLSEGVVSGAPQDFEVAILSEADASIDCSVTDSGAQADLVFFLGFVQNPVVFLQALPDSSRNTIFVKNSSTPALWQAGRSTKLFDASINNSSTTVVAGVGGQTITVHGWTNTFSAIAAATAILESDEATPGSVQYDIWNAVGTVGPFKGDAKGVACPVGAGLRIRNPFAVAVVVRGAVQFTQS